MPFSPARIFQSGIVSLCAVLAVVLLVSGCERTASSAGTVTLGIVLFGDSRQPQVNGFIDGLADLGYRQGRSVRYLFRNAKNDRGKLRGMVEDLIAQKVKILVAAGGLEADTMRAIAAPRGIPVVVLYINSIVERHLVESRRRPGWGVTGVDNLNAELSGKRMELLHNLLPDAKRVLVLYYKRIAPSRIGVERARAAADKLGMVVDARAVTSRDGIRRVMQELKPGDEDAMLMVPNAPIDNALKDIILPEVRRLKLPLMTHSRSLAKVGALASYGANFYDMGNQAARLAGKVLSGIRPANIPFETPKRFIYTINRDVQSDLNIRLNDLARSQVNEFISTER
jgi:putative ABC transport system substrate-binding protein